MKSESSGLPSANELREEMRQFRTGLERIESDLFSWSCQPEKSFKDKENFPIDFQIFMEEIGPCYSSSGRREGYQVIYLVSPEDAFEPEFKNGFFYIKHLGDVRSDQVCVIARDVNNQDYGFLRSKVPYQFFSHWGEDWLGDSTMSISFWHWFQKHLLDAIEYIDPDLVPKLKTCG